MHAQSFREESANRHEVCPRSRGVRPEGHLLLPTQARPLQTPGPSTPHEGTGGGYLGGWLPGLNSPQVLVQFRAQLGQLSLQQDLGRMMGKDLGSGKGERRRGGTESSAQCVWGRWSKVSYEKASGQQDKAHSAGARAGSWPVCLPAGLQVSGGPCHSLSRALPPDPAHPSGTPVRVP